MAGNQRTVEFILKARNEASAAFNALGESLRGLKQAQTQAASSTGAANPALAQQRTLAQQLAASIDGLKTAFTGTAKAQAEAAAAVQKATAEYAGQAAKVKALRDEQSALNARVKELTLAGNIVQQFEKLSTEIDKLAQREKAAKIEVDRLTASLQQQKAAAALAGDAGNSDARRLEIKKTEAAIAALNKELSNTGRKLGIEQQLAALTADLDRLSAKAQKAGVSVADLVKPFNQLEAELAQVRAQALALDPALARDGGQLAMLGNRVKATTAALNQMAAAEAKAAAQHKAGMDLQRTSLSFYQRLRGQVLGITAAYVGLYGVVNQVTQAFKAGATQRGIENTLLAANGGNQSAAAEELKYAREAADGLGQQYLAVGESYAKFRASIGDKLPLEKQRFLFESVGKAATVMRLSTEDTQGVFTALNQMFSKGSINAEELRQQLGDRLPGAVSFLAKGMGISEKELMKLMETGRLSADNMLLFAEQLNKKFGPGFAAALKSPQAELNKTINKVTDLRTAFEKAAEKAGLADMVAKIGEALADPKVKAGVEALGRFFVDMIGWLPVIIQHLDKLAAALLFLSGVKAALVLKSLYTTLIAGAPALAAAAGRWLAFGNGLGAAVAKVTGIAGALYYLYTVVRDFAAANPEAVAAIAGAFVRAWQQAVTVAKLGWSHISELFSRVWTSLKFNLQIVGASVTAFVKKVIAGLDILIVSTLNKLLGGAAKLAEALGQNDLANKMRNAMLSVNKELIADAQAAQDRVTALEQEKNDTLLASAQQAADERAAIRREDYENEKAYQAALDDLALRQLEREKKATAGAPDAPFAFADGGDNKPVLTKGKDKAAEKAATALDNLLEKTREAMAEIAIEIAKGTTYSLEGEMAAIESSYVKLFVDIQELAAKNKITPALKAQWEEQLNAIIEIQKTKLRNQDILTRGDALRGTLDERLGAVSDRAGRGEITEQKARADRDAIRAGEKKAQLAQLELERGLAAKELAAAQIANGETAIALAEQKIAANDRQIEQLNLIEDQIITVAEVNNRLADGMVEVTAAFADAAAAGDGLSGAFKAAGEAFRSFAASFLRDIAQMILKALFLKAIESTSVGASIVSLISPVKHSGGVIGATGGDRTRAVSPAWFANARRFHSGGLPGLKADEVPAILQRGEEVLSKSNPRNVLNGGGNAGGQSVARPQDIKIINAIDAGSFVSEGLATPEGTKALMNFVRANKSSFKSALA